MLRSTLFALACILLSAPLYSADMTPRIVGGKIADAEWHTLAALISISRKQAAQQSGLASPVYEAQYCGGTILASHWILTAAHCVRTKVNSGNGTIIVDHTGDIEVLVGSQTLDVASNSSQLLGVSAVFLHPAYNLDTLENDIALLKLSEPVPSINTVSPIVLSVASTDTELENATSYNDILTGLGWGSLTPGNQGYEFTQDLHEVALDYLTNQNCQSIYNSPPLETIHDTMLCARELITSAPYGEDTCSGDSGGPLFMGEGFLNDRPQVGITSYGYECGDAANPGIYTRVSKFVPWIETLTVEENRPVGDLSIHSPEQKYHGESSTSFDISVRNSGFENHPDFRILLARSVNLQPPLVSGPDFGTCQTAAEETVCDFIGGEFTAGDQRTLSVTIDSLSKGYEQLRVTVEPTGHEDYHRLNDSVTLDLQYGYPELSLSAEPLCLSSAPSNAQMRIEAMLSNSSDLIHSEGTRVTGTLPEGLTLLSQASPNCSQENDIFTCTVGQLNANSTLSTIIAVTATPSAAITLDMEIDNDNGPTPNSTLPISVELDFDREDLPACPAIPAPVSNVTSNGSSGGGGALSMALLLGLPLLGIYRKRYTSQ
ncbi:serine endopeptidase [Alcanivorax nanhaiticus]|uniref:Serine endopeptidase n=1 Tax=Alcanivorax nanhaiticus TaxID=1177154 RepID=A0A095TSK4_9GAMM|nr:trypsin-like serine protease [Alcanivorax nanhaiticus]KGD65383.1 serine endopeptidase [Alcanivorax nanhaiticus]